MTGPPGAGRPRADRAVKRSGAGSPVVIPYRAWGRPPFSVVLVHGGPGAPGEMGPVARELSAQRGVLEPFQSADSVAGQVQELVAQLQGHAALPAVLVGHSWGAMLALLVAAASPRTVARLVLVGSGPLDPSSARGIMAARLGSLGPGDRAELIRLHESLGDLSAPPEPAVLERYGELVARADAVDPVYPVPQEFPPDPEIHRLVWSEAAALRASGYFVEQARLVACPIAVIHGENDPHPFEGVVEPLHAAGVSPRVHVLTACGHTPWIERRARERFFALLRQELVAPVRP